MQLGLHRSPRNQPPLLLSSAEGSPAVKFNAAPNDDNARVPCVCGTRNEWISRRLALSLGVPLIGWLESTIFHLGNRGNSYLFATFSHGEINQHLFQEV